MRYGNIGTPNLIDPLFSVVYDSGELSSAATTITVTVDGNVDEEYIVIARHINGYSGTAGLYLRLNNDSGSNYGTQLMKGQSSTASASRSTSDTSIMLGYGTASNRISFGEFHIHAESGFVRTITGQLMFDTTGTTIDTSQSSGCVWNNTANNLTSLVFFSDQANGIGVGSRIIVLKKNDSAGMRLGTTNVLGKAYGCWQKIYDNTLSSAATTISISSLDGNTDVLWMFLGYFVSNYSGTGGANCALNSDTGTNYGRQYFQGVSSTLTAGRQTASTAHPWGGNGSALGEGSWERSLLYVKSGYVRVALYKFGNQIGGTTVTRCGVYGTCWNNTADNITSLTINGAQTNIIGIGSHYEIWRLNLA